MPGNRLTWGNAVSEEGLNPKRGIPLQSGEISRGVFKCRENRGDVTRLGARARA